MRSTIATTYLVCPPFRRENTKSFRSRIIVAVALLMSILVACGSGGTTIVHADANQSAQLERINANTPPGSG